MKHLWKALIALAAFAALAVVPAVASAENDITLQQPTGTSLAPTHAAPIPIVGTSNGKTLLLDSSGNTLISCDTAIMTGNLETNTHTAVEGTITSAQFHNEGKAACTASLGTATVTTGGITNGLNWCLRSTSTMATDEFQVRGNGCTSASRGIRFTLHTSFAGTCEYERTTAIPGKYTTHPAQGEAEISNVEFKRISGLCPWAAGFLQMKFKLYRETSPGSHLADPIYIVNAT